MLKFLGVVFISMLLGAGAVSFNFAVGNNFVETFAQGQSLQIMATALALNVATITFLCGSLLSLEKDLGKPHFNSTRRELKHNVIAMAIIFLINFFVVGGIKLTSDGGPSHLDIGDLLGWISVSLLFIFGSLILETSLLILKIRNNGQIK